MNRRIAGIAGRILFIWAIEVAAMLLMDRLLPRLRIDNVLAAVATVALMGLFNAVVWPTVIYFALPLAIYSGGIASLALNVAVLLLVGSLVPGFHLEGIVTATLAAMGVALISTSAGALITVDEEHSWYRRSIRERIFRSVRPEPTGVPGLVFFEIDGLALPVLRRAIERNYMPTLKRWLEGGSHRLMAWETDLSSQTAASQAGILHGNNWNLPAFRWVRKSEGRLMVTSKLDVASQIEAEHSDGMGLLADGGASRSNLLSGDAPSVMLTASRMGDGGSFSARNFYAFFANPYNLVRTAALLVLDIVVEKVSAWYQTIINERPRVKRRGKYPFVRAFTTVVVSELVMDALMSDMFAGVPVAYATLIPYDEVAHFSGLERRDALLVLKRLDQQLARLESAARLAPRPYHFVVLSDHGQTQGATFAQRHGQTLEELVRSLVDEGRRVGAPVHAAEGWGHLNVLITQAIQDDRRLVARALRRAVKRKTHDGEVVLGPEAAHYRQGEGGDQELKEVEVLASGCLGLIYFCEYRERLTLEQINALFPGLVFRLAQHEGIGLVLVQSERHGPIAAGPKGSYYLAEDRWEGENPLAPFGPRAADHLRRTNGFPDAPDILVNSAYDPRTEEGAAFEEQVSSHGGLGGPQTAPFILYPAAFPAAAEPLVGAESVHRVFKGWLAWLAGRDAGSDKATARPTAQA